MKFTSRLASRFSPDIKGLFYDWDNTLIRLRGVEFLESINKALYSVGCEGIGSLKESKSIRHTFATRCHDRAEEAMTAFREEFAKYPISEADLMPGAKDLIEQVHSRGILQGIVSNLDQQVLNQEIERLGFNHYFPVIMGSKHDDHLKPKPDLLIEAIKLSGLSFAHADRLDFKLNRNILYIGDGSGDVVAANRAGCTSILVSTEEIEATADIKTKNLHEVLDIMNANRSKQGQQSNIGA